MKNNLLHCKYGYIRSLYGVCLHVERPMQVTSAPPSTVSGVPLFPFVFELNYTTDKVLRCILYDVNICSCYVHLIFLSVVFEPGGQPGLNVADRKIRGTQILTYPEIQQIILSAV